MTLTDWLISLGVALIGLAFLVGALGVNTASQGLVRSAQETLVEIQTVAREMQVDLGVTVSDLADRAGGALETASRALDETATSFQRIPGAFDVQMYSFILLALIVIGIEVRRYVTAKQEREEREAHNRRIGRLLTVQKTILGDLRGILKKLTEAKEQDATSK